MKTPRHFRKKLPSIISKYLTVHPVQQKTGFTMRLSPAWSGAGQMEAHDFEEMLKRVAEPNAPEGSTSNGMRWYLKETELNVVDSAETTKEDAAAEKTAKFITEFLKKHPETRGRSLQ